MIDVDLVAFYNINHILSLNYQYRIEEMEDMLPWERTVYVALIEKYIKDKNEEIRKKNQENQHR